jgi:hypothetical protein
MKSDMTGGAANKLLNEFGRGEWIQTTLLLVPNQGNKNPKLERLEPICSGLVTSCTQFLELFRGYCEIFVSPAIGSEAKSASIARSMRCRLLVRLVQRFTDLNVNRSTTLVEGDDK